MYVSSSWRVVRGILLGGLYCALAVSLKADVVDVNGTMYWAFNYDGCSPANVTIQYSVLWADDANPYDNEYVGGHVWNTYTGGVEPGENLLAAVGAADDPGLAIYGQNEVTSSSSGLNGYLPAQSWSQLQGPSCPSVVTWANSLANPCAGQSGPCESIDNFALGGP
jgi:hypothetical protein